MALAGRAAGCSAFLNAMVLTACSGDPRAPEDLEEAMRAASQ